MNHDSGNDNGLPIQLRGVIASIPELGAKKIELPIQNGLHVFYGLNGVGKSRLMGAIENGAFDVYAPLLSDDAKWRSIGWETAFDWSYGSEPELSSVYISDIHDFVDSALSPAVQALEMSDLLEDYLFIDERFTGLKRDWVWRIVVWVGGLHTLPSGREELTVDAVAEFIEQGQLRIKPKINDQGSWTSSCEIEHWVTVSPEFPAIWRFFIEGKDRISSNDFASYAAGGFLQDAMMSDLDETGWGPPSPDGRYMEFSRSSAMWGPTAFISILTDRPPATEDELFATIETALWRKRPLSLFEDGPLSGVELGPLRQTSANLADVLLGISNGGQTHPVLEIFRDYFTKMATMHFRRLLQNAPELRLCITAASEWRHRPRLDWEMKGSHGHWIPIADGSDTQARLASIATQLATQDPNGYHPVILLLDEPERGLHRRAEMHLLRGLETLTKENPNFTVIAASHSPLFLRPDIATLHHVTKDSEGALEIKRLPAAELGNADQLGISTTDLLQLTRVVLLVEGQHDEWVLNSLFNDEFGRLGVRVMSMRGATRLAAAAEGQLLFDYTDAAIIVMLDNLNNEKMSSIYNEAQVEWSDTHRLDLVEKKLQRLLPRNRMTEASALKDFCLAAIRLGRHDRVSFAMLEKQDIPHYFDTSHFLPHLSAKSPTWEELKREHKIAKKKDSATPNLKRWLEETYGAKFTKRAFMSAVRSVEDDIPCDLQEVLRAVQRVSALHD